MRATSFAALLLVVLVVEGAYAKDPPKAAVLDEAAALAEKGETLKAAARYGDAVAAAQSAGDLEAEDTAAYALDRFFEKLPPDAAGTGQTSAAPSRSAVLAATMRELDPKRAGALVSASVLARNVLELATESGDLAAVADAAKIASKSTPGAAAAVVGKYAEGMAAVAEGHADKATAPLAAAAAEAAKAKWYELSAHACTELAAAWVALGAPEKAVAAVEATAAQFGDDCGGEVVMSWASMLQARGGSAAADLQKPILFDLMRRVAKVPSRGGAGAAGQRGADGGASPDTDIAKLLPKFPKGKAFASAKRTADGFAIAWATNPKEHPVQPFVGSVGFAQEGGVTLSVHGRTVALAEIRLTLGGRAGAGGRNTPSAVRAYYLIAEGETWGVTKDGVVTITK